jgi:hypothetical protein
MTAGCWKYPIQFFRYVCEKAQEKTKIKNHHKGQMERNKKAL